MSALNFPLYEQTACCLLDVLTTAQRLTALAGCCIADAVHRNTEADGWRAEEIPRRARTEATVLDATEAMATATAAAVDAIADLGATRDLNDVRARGGAR